MIEEWERIFDEAVRLVESSFVDEKLLPVDWEHRVELYRNLLLKIRSRDELNDVLGELLAELGTSHLMIFGGTSHPSGANIASLGADIQWKNNAWMIMNVYNSGIEKPFRLPNDVEGMCIRDIDGQKPKKGVAFGQYLAGKIGEFFFITVQDCEKTGVPTTVKVQGLSSAREVKELDWMLRNREFVHAQTNGTIGYLHLPNLQEEGLRSLERWIDVECRENGIIIDLRYNAGGYYEATAIERIFRTKLGEFSWSNQKSEDFPYRSTSELRRVFLVNGATQSAGEGLALGARDNEVILIGTKTWGGYSSITQKEFSDGGVVGVTTVIWSGNPIENKGVEPDIIVSGEEEQLKRAIEILME